MLELLRRLVAEEGAALLFITHDLAVIASMCERVLVMQEGTIVESGPTAEVFATPRHPHTQALIAGTRALSDPPVVAEPAPRGERTVILEARGLVREYAMPRTSLRRLRRASTHCRASTCPSCAATGSGSSASRGRGSRRSRACCIALDQPQAGEVRFEDTPVTGRKERDLRFLRRQAQIVFQDPMSSLDPRMRVREIVLEPLQALAIPGDHGERVRELLQSVGLPADAANRYPHQFSGGQRQRDRDRARTGPRAVAPDRGRAGERARRARARADPRSAAYSHGRVEVDTCLHLARSRGRALPVRPHRGHARGT